ncbi:MAG: type I restriction-modification system subunit M [Lactobacillus sp.]|jgi:type I restriction enzyme M protein|uniref:site-specific DNA-methyltransferase (adenine-specific) n=1 Tax=Lacticaseibacillus suilingensis TaxID=2799577 RepID=A0ABW4BKV3_9LACO|nr:type I restriction-modification system subunit M [Lacticaseibacillus suilingensis]MCI1895003.1 type I restriction-modification system subunit M [Lactobacillus sp.]MCI1942165.1 type I restriction-modification system subunit M [Lactobacillus sp.]MCI1972549.1 type I restriction-modification system subunit M [Lactobacillus sp.]MCI2037028.1 type I restriction-modification system subunit M [Lactobacillus sp.]
MEKLNTAKDITSQLWAMANELRGNMDASEFRNYILGFMFYRYLSEHQEQYLLNQKVVEPAAGQSLNDAYRSEAVGDDLKDYQEDISKALGYAIDPEYTWDSIRDKVNNDEIRPSDYQEMFDAFNRNAAINPNASSDFREVFADVNLGNTRLGASTTARAKALNGVVKLIDQFDYNDASGHDIIGDVYEYLIAEFAGNSGKKAGEFYTPHEVSVVLSRLATLGAAESGQFTVYDPTMGSGSLLLTVQNELKNGHQRGRVKFHGQELNTTTYNLARMNLMMHGVDYQNMDLRNADTLEGDWPDGEVNGVDHPRSFDAVVANPPYSANWDNNDNKMKDPRFKGYKKLAPKSKADYAFVLHGLYHLNATGRMAIVLPHGVLFRGAAEGMIRQAIIENNYLDAVIGMPASLFYSTSIPTVILVFKKNRKTKDILFIDASNDFEKGKKQNRLREQDIEKIISTYQARKNVDKYAHVASLDEIKENDYNLNIPRYVDTFEEEAPIDIADVKRQISDIDQQLAEVEMQFAAMESELVETEQNDK